MENSYRPKPIATDHVVVEDELLQLVEQLAEHAHEIWAHQRLGDGWAFGPLRDDALRQHPCLVPYSALPESEKIYDRNAALGTIRAVIALGFMISRPKHDLQAGQ